MRILNRAIVAMVLAVSAVAALATPAQAETISFTNVTSNSSSAADYATEFTLTVAASGSDIRFTFHNNRDSGDGGRIANVFWDTNDGDTGSVLLSSFASLNGGNWSAPASQSNPPGGNNLDPVFAADFSADPDEAADRIEEGESAYFDFVLTTNTSVADVVAAIRSGEMRIAFHAIGFSVTGSDTTTSDTFVTTTIVPEPTSVALMAIGLGALLVLDRRRRLRILED